MDVGVESIAITGLAFGLRNALEADHVMAVASPAGRQLKSFTFAVPGAMSRR